ncbi:hypothetical protein AGMMS49990_00030 [Endomicrobiia bacterium]|nr:hypothetical protein AGMMS49990_00030 [Endomicrobiia bacterium]
MQFKAIWLERLKEQQALPEESTTVGNRHKFSSRAFDEWAYKNNIKLNFIQPVSLQKTDT